MRTNRIIMMFVALAVASLTPILLVVLSLSWTEIFHNDAAATLPLSTATSLPSDSETKSNLGATGKVFTGDKIRQYRGSRQLVRFPSRSRALKQSMPLFPGFDVASCEQWAVVTTIFKPQLAFQKILDLSTKWCLIIVGDEITPDAEYEQLSRDHSHLYYLSATYQKHNLESNEFMARMPYKSFARKNIGYLFALYHGAKVIFDFDDDNILTPVLENTTLAPPFFWKNQIHGKDEWPEASMLLQFFDAESTSKDPRLSFNPFKYMKASVKDSWPRGFPLDDLQEDFETPAKEVLVGDIPYTAIGVIQALCDGNPDTDAIFRLTRAKATDFYFLRSIRSLPLLVPFSHYTPYNAQATTHLQASFWGLYLPISVPGRVTDIWRSYIVQRLMKDVGLHLVYSQPIVQHKRSPHDYLADFAAESDLYHKTAKLLNHIDGWSSDNESFPHRILDLWIELFEHDYLGLDDVEAVKQWLNSLISMGYVFPPLIEEGHILVARSQPTLEYQPYRSFPNYPQSGRLSDPQMSGNMKIMRPNRPEMAVVKIIMMTMNEWPLVKNWVLYHGNMFGFQNLYIIDSSENSECKAFLIYARDILGVNVLFSSANLNKLEKIMTRVGRDLSGSSDYILKMDTDEYLAVYDEDSHVLKPSLIKQYRSELLKNLTKPEDHTMCARFVSDSVPAKDVCAKDISAGPHLFPYHSVYSSSRYKAIYDSRYIHKYKINLGGHSHFLGGDCINKGNFGIIHAHWRCFDLEMENSRRVLMRHNYINETDSKEIIIQKLSRRMASGIHQVDECTYIMVSKRCVWPSCHKAAPYMNYLSCPDKARDQFYSGTNIYTNIDHKSFNVADLEQSHLNDFADTMDFLLAKFGH